MIVLSCGHEINDFKNSYDVILKCFDREGEKALKHMVVCRLCRDTWKREGYLFETDQVAYEWINSTEW